MKYFAELITRLDQSNKTGDKVEALVDFFEKAADEEKVWAVAIFSHRRPKRQVSTKQLRNWCQELAGIPDWLFDECYHAVGDLAETIALLLPKTTHENDKNLGQWIEFLQALEMLPEELKKENIQNAWSKLDYSERFVFNKIITGGFRIGVSQSLMSQALAKVLQLDKSNIAHALMGNWNPQEVSFPAIFDQEEIKKDSSKPYPFFLAYPLETTTNELGDIADWQAEWKWDGIRGQLIRRNGETFIWSRGEELVNDKFPELLKMAENLPNGTVIDGEIIAFKDGNPLPFALLQTRIGRKNISKKQLQEAPISLLAYDLLEFEGKDIRGFPISKRRELLVEIYQNHPHERLQVPQLIKANTWEALGKFREQSRVNLAEGLMLKKADSSYETGRKRGSWWKWKIEPLTIDGIMIYAQKGHGRRADLYSDYTFAVWDGENLVPFAKAYSGLTDAEMREVDAFVKKNTRERFGPVRTVKAELVFEIAFEGIQDSPRHKSGIALRFPRILRWRKDKPKEEANTLEDLKALLKTYGG
ncbi:DNA ligase-1 [Algoriphagus alkaliphilus]|uniref:DNA ligase (ATP) n=1 Tax=Algoriphagus alkaliphilus TaxID=279824 RepID=A0A1G5VDN9_9BACT|nr:ATP-dependent DNA ligase [Algoriphagus alkaliphilus]MBA4299718.1 ATP-dependent DNA ligase [Cyclobacterium sp.]SDA43506.1 DNA ligase-1 [Algoriphagus alkaliphilus]